MKLKQTQARLHACQKRLAELRTENLRLRQELRRKEAPAHEIPRRLRITATKSLVYGSALLVGSQSDTDFKEGEHLEISATGTAAFHTSVATLGKKLAARKEIRAFVVANQVQIGDTVELREYPGHAWKLRVVARTAEPTAPPCSYREVESKSGRIVYSQPPSGDAVDSLP